MTRDPAKLVVSGVRQTESARGTALVAAAHANVGSFVLRSAADRTDPSQHGFRRGGQRDSSRGLANGEVPVPKESEQRPREEEEVARHRGKDPSPLRPPPRRPSQAIWLGSR